MTVPKKDDEKESSPPSYEPPTLEQVTPPQDTNEEDLPQAEPIEEEQERVQLIPDDEEIGDNTLLFKGELQPPAYRDAWCAVLFILQLIAVITTAAVYGPVVFKDMPQETGTNTTDHDDGSSNNTDDQDEDNKLAMALAMLYFLLLLTGFFLAATLATFMSLRTLLQYPTQIVKISFFTAPVVMAAVALLGTIAASTSDNGDVTAYVYLWILAAVGALLTLCWYKCYARFIPFAASTLRTAAQALKGQAGLYVLQLTLWCALFIYTAVWCLAVGGVYAQAVERACPNDNENTNAAEDADTACDEDNVPINLPAVFGLLLSLYWTQQVVQNLIHTTTSGIVGTWWFAPSQDDAQGCCGPAVTDSFYRASTYSLGSICFGSLLVSIMQVLERLARSQRHHRRGGGAIVALVVQCLLICLRSLLEYFNSWAFCYVGLYGYSYLDAGKNVVRLFNERGWTVFISDRLIFRVLFLINVAVAALNGFLCMIVGWIAMMLAPGSVDTDALQGLFWIGFVIGLYVSGTLLFVLESATRTTMVLFAESAREFAQVHEELHQDLKDGWSTSYPDDYAQAVATAQATPVI